MTIINEIQKNSALRELKVLQDKESLGLLTSDEKMRQKHLFVEVRQYNLLITNS